MIRVTIREAAKRRGYKNAYQFGQSIGVARMVASRIWKNEDTPKLETLDKICNAWRCRLDELIEHKLDKRPSNGHGSTILQKQAKRTSRTGLPTASSAKTKRVRSGRLS